MKIWSLMDDVSAGEGWEKEHGLSLYLETKRHRILFDTGKSGLFLKNAERAGIDISAVDTAVLSHGHYDHGGGLADFLERSRTAPVYIQEGALEPHYSRRAGGRIEEIGVDPALKKNPRLVTVRGALKIDEELTVFGRVPGEELLSEANRLLLEREIFGRIPRQYPYSWQEALSMLKARFQDFSEEELRLYWMADESLLRTCFRDLGSIQKAGSEDRILNTSPQQLKAWLAGHPGAYAEKNGNFFSFRRIR